jgi:hypothetical protein
VFSGSLRADAHGLWIDGRLVTRRESVRHTYVLPPRGAERRPVLCLRALLQDVSVSVDRESDADDLLSAMRFDSPSMIERFTMILGTRRRAWARAFATGLVLTATLSLFSRTALVWLIPLTVASSALLEMLQYCHVTIENDRICFRRFLGAIERYGYSDIRNVVLKDGHVTIHIRSGRILSMHPPHSVRLRRNVHLELVIRSLRDRILQRVLESSIGFGDRLRIPNTSAKLLRRVIEASTENPGATPTQRKRAAGT